MRLSPLIIGLIILAVLIAGAFAGCETRRRLPAYHLNDETKSLVSVSRVKSTLSERIGTYGLFIIFFGQMPDRHIAKFMDDRCRDDVGGGIAGAILKKLGP